MESRLPFGTRMSWRKVTSVQDTAARDQGDPSASPISGERFPISLYECDANGSRNVVQAERVGRDRPGPILMNVKSPDPDRLRASRSYVLGGLGLNPAISIPRCASGFFINVFQTNPVRAFSAITIVMPVSIPTTSVSYQPVSGLNASTNP